MEPDVNEVEGLSAACEQALEAAQRATQASPGKVGAIPHGCREPGKSQSRRAGEPRGSGRGHSYRQAAPIAERTQIVLRGDVLLEPTLDTRGG